MSDAKKIEKTSPLYWVHVVIGLLLMIGFPQLDPIEPITEVGMWIGGIFLGMVYLWSALDSIWPSILGLLLIALYSGYTGPEVTGYNAVKQVFGAAVGSDTVICILFGMVLFGAIQQFGCTKYLARFFLTRKCFMGRPYVFLFVVFVASFFISGFTMPIASLLILWSLMIETLKEFGYKKDDKIIWVSVFGIYLASTLGQPLFPFRGAALGITGAFTAITGESVNYSSYILYNLIISAIILLIFLAFIKFIVRPDVTKMKAITPEYFKKNTLPPMNIQQKSILITCFVFIFLLLIPNFLPADWAIKQILESYNSIGIFSICLIVLMIIPIKGKSLFAFKEIAKNGVSWDIFFMVAAAMYICNAVSDDVTGIKQFLVQILQPLLGNKPDLIFVMILIAFIIITTNFANNAGMAIIIMPIVVAFSGQYPDVPTTALCMTITMAAFVALLTPAASPFCAMMHANKEYISFKQIIILGLPVCVIALIIYTVVGFPIAKLLF